VPGPLEDYLAGKGLRLVPARPLKYRPAPSRIAQLTTLARRQRLDLVHAYEWPPCLDAYFGAHLLVGTRLVCTVYSMDVPPFVPRTIPLVMGTPALRDEAAAAGFGRAWLLEPPIDTQRDRPGTETDNFRAERGIAPDELLVVCTSRLALTAKLESLVEAMDAVDIVASELPVRFFLLGEGDAYETLVARADAVNRRHAREVISLPGPVPDPRGAYAAADVVVGMGTSILRGMAFEKPVIVQGEQGFAVPFTPGTSAHFLDIGMWGLGDGTPAGERMAATLRELLSDPALRASLGRYGRDVVEDRFSLRRAVDRQLELYRDAMRLPVARSSRETSRVAAKALELEWHNHDPRRKRARALETRARYEAARKLVEPPT
jgi:glycosyltransferase involved in cell wall biosynthesis